MCPLVELPPAIEVSTLNGTTFKVYMNVSLVSMLFYMPTKFCESLNEM